MSDAGTFFMVAILVTAAITVYRIIRVLKDENDFEI